MTEIGVTEARDQLGELVNRVAYSDARIVRTRHGRAMAAPVPIAVLHDLVLQPHLFRFGVGVSAPDLLRMS